MPEGFGSKRIRLRQTGESKWFNLFNLRRLYNPNHIGRGTEGLKSRYALHPTLTYPTYLLLTRTVPVGRGSYGSPVVEIAIRLLMATVCRSISIETIAGELSQAVKDRATLARNLRDLSDAVLMHRMLGEKALNENRDAAQLTWEERNPDAWLQRVTDRKGHTQGFHQIIEVARSAGIYARFQNNWQFLMNSPQLIFQKVIGM